ncbi:MAG: hypothetical protein JOZ32_06090 [Bryobacterales bacterium]|nr:hypothetical protein [Bryobacterales bacterium]
MSEQTNPDERFDQVESTLNQLSNSFRHLLTAQVLMNDRLERVARLVEQLAEQGLQTSQHLHQAVEVFTEFQKRTDEKIEALTDNQKHTDSKLDALTDIVRQWIERHGNGNVSH